MGIISKTKKRLALQNQPFLVDFWSNSYIFAGDYNKQRVWIK